MDARGAWLGPLRRLGAASAIGAAVGFAIGGVGGRMAMLVLRLTSDPALRGRSTDDGFTIGVISGETTFLLILATVLGALAGAGYFLARGWLPRRGRVWITASIGGVVGGAAIVHPDGLDFSVLRPLSLAVAMFVVIPAAAAAATAALGERVLSGERVESHTRWLVGLVPFGVIALAGPLAAAAVAFAAIVAVAWPEIRRSGERWTSPIVTVAGRVALAGGAVLAAGSLVRDALDVL